MKMKDNFAFHFECGKCGKHVNTNLVNLEADKLCHDCMKRKRMVERIMEDKGLMGIINQLMNLAGDMTGQDASKLDKGQVIEDALKQLQERDQKKKDDMVAYTCPVCGGEGFFQSNKPYSQEDKEMLQGLPACPECMVKKAMKQAFFSEKEESMSGMPRTEGPVGPRPTIVDPDDIPPVKDKKDNGEQGLAA